LGYGAFWIGVIIIFATAGEKGADIDKIVKGVDWQGRICGKDNGVANLKYAAWPDPALNYQAKICVSDCATTQTWDFSIKYKTNRFTYYCIPFLNLNTTDPATISGNFNNQDHAATRAMGDMWVAAPIIAASAAIALAFSYYYTYVAKKFAGFMVWSLILFLAGAGLLCGYALLQNAESMTNDPATKQTSQSTIKGQRALGWILVIGTMLFLCIVFFLRKRILIAIEVIKEASRALNALPGIIFFPLLPFAIGVGFIFWWIVITLYIFSVTEPKAIPAAGTFPLSYFDDDMRRIYGSQGYNGTYIDLVWDRSMKNSFIYHFFHLLWTIQFLIYFSYLVIAGAIANWYFSYREPDGSKKRGDGVGELPHNPTFQSCLRTTRFHLGSVAFGSLIIAIIQMARFIVKYIEETTKAKNNQLQRIVFCLIQCFLSCIECCCDKLSKTGYVWMAIWGDSFVPATCNAFLLVWRNLARIAALGIVSEIVLTMGKLFVAVLTTGLAALIMRAAYPDTLTSVAMPCFVVFMMALLIGEVFMLLYETTIDTVMICFLVDEECNLKSGQLFASPELSALVGAHAAQSQELATQSYRGKPPPKKQSNFQPVSDAIPMSGVSSGGGGGGGGGGGFVGPDAYNSGNMHSAS